MNLYNIEAFLTVIQKGSLTEAAQQLNITQPTLTHRIQMLEADLGVPLLLRGKGVRRVDLTDAGRSFVPVAEKWTKLRRETENIASLAQKKTFSVTTSHSLSYYLMPIVYARFISRNLPMKLTVKVFHSQEAYDSVEYRETDMALITNPKFSKRVSAIPIFEEPMVFLCSLKSAYGENPRPSELPAERGIYMDWTHEYSLWHEYWFGANRQIVESESIRLVERIIAETDCWAVVPLYVAEIAVKNGGLRYCRLQDPPPNRTTYLLTLTPQHEYTNLLVEDLRAVIAQL